MNDTYFTEKIEDMPAEEVRQRQAAFREMELPRIAVLDFVYSTSVNVAYEFPELTAICPMTGLPDTYTAHIRFMPDKFLPELKSLRNYLLCFRDIPVLHEHLVCRIHEDFSRDIAPGELDITLDVAVRGGIKTRVSKQE